jgi:hypothetical protein
MEDRNRKSIGLPGGPNEYITHISQVFSIEGYKRNSPDVNNPFNLIDSGNITMEGVDFPVLGTDNLGNQQLMIPGNNYQFPGDQVFEVPYMQFGGENPSATQVGVNPNANAKGRYLKDFTTTQVNPLSVINYTGPSNEGVVSRQLPDEWYNTGKTDPTGNPIMERTEFIDVGPTTDAYLKNNVSVNMPGTIDEHEKMLKKLNRSNFTGSHGFRGRGWDTGLSDEAKALFKEENPFFEKGRVRTLDYDLTNINNPKKKEAYSNSRIAYFADGGVPNFTEQTRMREGSYNKGKEEIIDPRFRKAQTGTEIKTYKNVNDILTYKNNPDWFDSRARYQDDQKYDDVIRRAIYSGKYGYDPKTKMLHPLAPEDQVVVSDKIKNIRAAEEKTITERDRVRAMSPEDQEADRKRKIASQLAAEGKTPMKVDEIGSRSNPLLREEDKTGSRPWEGKEGQTLWLTPEQTAAYNKDYVAKSNVAMAENPLFYAPGIIGASAFAPTALASLGDATYGALAPAVSAPLTIGGTSVPGATMSNAITAGFAGHGLTNVVPDAVEMYNNPSWANAGSLAIDALEIAPIVGAASQLTNEGLAAANKLGNKYLPNAYNRNPYAGKLNKYNRIVGEDAVDDFYKSGLVRTPQNLEKQKAGTINLNREGTTPYPSFGEGAPNIAENAYAQKIINKGETPYIISTDMPMGVSTLGRHGRGSTLFPVDASGKYLENFSAENAKIFEANPHWLKGYQEVPKQLPGSPNNFKSEIDLGLLNIKLGAASQLQEKQYGGETEMLSMYTNYINGIFDGTDMEQAGKNIYDKLNRIYYKDAKKMEMSSPNYILTHIINKA